MLKYGYIHDKIKKILKILTIDTRRERKP